MRKNKDGEDVHLVQIYFTIDLLEKVQEHARIHKRSLSKQVLWMLEQKLENPAEILTFEDARCAWFRHEGKPYPVASAPTPIFKAALFQEIPHTWVQHKEYRHLLKQKELDMHDRWYLLCSLIEVNRPLPLYKSKN